MQYNINNGIIVLGGHVQALGIVRIFGELGLPVALIDNTAINIARHSKYCIDFHKVSDTELLDFLMEYGEKGKYKQWVIFPTNDFHVKLLSNHKKVLSCFYILAVDDWSVIQNFYYKKNTYKIAEKLNIPVPATYYPETESDLSRFDVSFPCIIKPSVMHKFYSGTGRKVLVCKNHENLRNNYKLALKYIPADEVLVQEIIPGTGENQFSSCFFSVQGEPVVSFSACRMRQHPLDFGNATTYAETVQIEEIIDYGEKLLKETFYTGLCEIEFKKDIRDNKYKFLEVNTRTWKWHLISLLSDSPFLISYYRYLTGQEYKCKHTFRQAGFRHGLTDIYVQLMMMLRGDKKWSQIITPTIDATFNKKDLKPWLYEKLYLLYFIVKR